jgi:hypothetical protein
MRFALRRILHAADSQVAPDTPLFRAGSTTAGGMRGYASVTHQRTQRNLRHPRRCPRRWTCMARSAALTAP